jgi:hypothetical protein
MLGIIDSTDQDTIESAKAFIDSAYSRFLIFDNLQDERLVKDLIIQRGHYIITTRLGNIEYEKIEVDSLSDDASVELLSNKLSDRTDNELKSLASFLQGHPLALAHSADYISSKRPVVDEYIQNYSSAIKLEFNNRRENKITNLKKILNNSISSLSEISQHVIKIVCLGDCDQIPYDLIYGVFNISYPNTSQNEFNQYLGEITRLSIFTYDTIKRIFKIFRVIKQVAIIQLFRPNDNPLIQYYSEYLYSYYNPQSDLYRDEEINWITNLTLQASKFLTQYKNQNLTTRDILNYSRIAISYLYFFNDESSKRKYLQIVEQSLRDQTAIDSDLAQAYANLEVLYYIWENTLKAMILWVLSNQNINLYWLKLTTALGNYIIL